MSYLFAPATLVQHHRVPMLFRPTAPYPAFCNGQKITVQNINVTSIFDDLEENVTFKYTLTDINQNWAGEGIYRLDKTNYDSWDATMWNAYEIVANAIGLELIQTGGATNPNPGE